MTASFLPVGLPAPPFELVAAYTRRVFSPAANLGTPILLVFITYATRHVVQDISLAVRERYPAARQVQVANLINLDFVPGLAQSTAKRMMDAELREAGKQLPPDFNPRDHLILLPDWKGSVFKAYRVGRLDDQIALVLIDSEGLVAGSYRGKDPAGSALSLLEAVLNSQVLAG